MLKYLFIYVVFINLVIAADYRVVKISEIPLAKDEYPDYTRIVAIGDVHGDYKKAKEALLLTGAFKTKNHQWQWVGGNTKVIQLGDQLDRGPDGKKILELFSYLRVLAKQGGGEFIPLIGNHEYMNLSLNFKYAHEKDPFYNTEKALFSDHELSDKMVSNKNRYCAETSRKNMCNAFRVGSYYRKILATQNVVVKVGGILFSHAGLVVLSSNPASLTEYNEAMRDWILLENFKTEDAEEQDDIFLDYFHDKDDSPVWNRQYQYEKSNNEIKVPNCPLLEKSLNYYKAKLMIVGHNIVSKISSFCGDKLWLIDVGMSKALFDNDVQVLEFVKGKPPKVLKKGILGF